jgi:hypothetical protein
MIKLFRWAGWLLAAAIVAVTLSPLELRPVTAAPANIERFVAFALAGGALCVGYPRYRLLIVLLVTAMAAGLEVLQHVIPGRHGQFGDLVMKAVGALTGAVVATLIGELPKVAAALRRRLA